MRVLILGAGAIGCLVGGKLAMGGHTVTLVGRPRFAEAVIAQGLRLRDEHGEHVIHSVIPAGSLAEGWNGAPFDLAILTVKSYDTAEAVAELVSVAGESLPVTLSLQNGVGNEETLAAALGPETVIAGTLVTPVSVVGPGFIRVDRPGYSLGLSAWDAATPNAVLSATQWALLDAGFNVKLYPDAHGMKWTKLLMNIMANAAGAILDLSPRDLMSDTRAINLEIAAWRETLAVMAASGIPVVDLGRYPLGKLAPLIRWGPRVALRRVLRQQVSSARGDKLASLHIDLRRGRQKSEIDWLNGAVVRQGERVDVATPVNRLLSDTLAQLIQDPRQQEVWRGNSSLLAARAQEYVQRG